MITTTHLNLRVLLYFQVIVSAMNLYGDVIWEIEFNGTGTSNSLVSWMAGTGIITPSNSTDVVVQK